MEYDQIKNELLFEAGKLASSIGLSKSMGQLYAALFFMDKPLSLNDLSVACRMSKGNASINIRRLEKWGAVRKVWGKDSRKDYYEANRDILKFLFGHGKTVFFGILSRGVNVIERVEKKVDEMESGSQSSPDKEKIESVKKGLKEMKSMSNKVESLAKKMEFIENIIRKG